MTETVTLTHHMRKPEYQWEIVIPEGPTVLLTADKIEKALDLLGAAKDDPRRQQILGLDDGASQGINTDLNDSNRQELASLGKQKMDVDERAQQS